MVCQRSMRIVAGDEPVYLTVRNTFFELEGLRTPTTRSLRTRSEPFSFKVAGRETDDEDALSVASTEASSEDGPPPRHPMLLPTAILRSSTTKPIAVEQTADPFSPQSCRGDGGLTASRKLTYLPTPSTLGRRTPENLPRPMVKQVSFALGGDSDGDVHESPRKTSCLRRPSWAGRRTRDNSPTMPARRVSFAAFDEVVHIPAEEVLAPEESQVVAPRPVALLNLASSIPPMMPEIELGSQSTVQLPWTLSVATPAFVPMSAAPVNEICAPSIAELPAKVSVALSGTARPCSQAMAAPSAPERALGAVLTSDAESKPTAQDPWAKFSEVVESVRASLERRAGIVACAEAKQGARGWTITAYVQPKALKPCRDQLLALAQQALRDATNSSNSIYLLGYGATPFTLMPLGFGAALADMPDKSAACWASFSKGFCDKPGACCRQHPSCQVGVNVMLKPARARAR